MRPILTIKDGTIAPVGVSRTRSGAIERLLERLRLVSNVRAVGIAHSSPDEEVASFTDKLKAFVPGIKPMIAKLGPAIGTHGGPGTILVAMQQELAAVEPDAETGRRRIVSLPSLQSIKEGILQRKQKDVTQFSSTKLLPAIQ